MSFHGRLTSLTYPPAMGHKHIIPFNIFLRTFALIQQWVGRRRTCINSYFLECFFIRKVSRLGRLFAWTRSLSGNEIRKESALLILTVVLRTRAEEIESLPPLDSLISLTHWHSRCFSKVVSIPTFFHPRFCFTFSLLSPSEICNDGQYSRDPSFYLRISFVVTVVITPPFPCFCIVAK